MASPTHGRDAPDAPPVLPSIPLSAEFPNGASQSVGAVVRDVTTQLSTLVRAEVELARAEVTAEVRKGLKGSVFFLFALAIVLFSLFFLFIALAELLSIWLFSWAAYLVVFGVMLLAAGTFALLGYARVRRIRAPERTISTVRDTAQALSHRGHSGGERGTGATALER